MAKRRLWFNLGTTRGAVAAGGTATRKLQVLFPFKVAYLRIENYIGQAGYLRVSVHVGGGGDQNDPIVWAKDPNAPKYFFGDGSVREFLNLTDEFPANFYVTAYYYNSHSTDAMSGAVEGVVEEV